MTLNSSHQNQVLLIFCYCAVIICVSAKTLEGTIDNEGDKSVTSARDPRVFFGTTTTSTTTLSTTTACYTSAAAISTACSRRRRSLIDTNPIEGSSKYPLIAPASTYDEYVEEEPTVIGHSVSSNRRNDKSMNLSKLDELNQIANVRTAEEKVEPRFFLFYWYTSTITTTATSYTKTTTFTIAGCTPAGSFSYAVCG